MAYAILRTAKLTSLGNIGGSARHAFRERETPNADPERTAQNRTNGAQSAREVIEAVKSRLETVPTVRKNAVLAIEYFVGASPEWFKAQSEQAREEYFDQAEKWLRLRHGDENVIAFNRQYDETSPHCTAYVVPIDPRGRLNCSHFLDGRQKLSQMQTDFAEKVGRQHGLERGIEGSKAKHQTIKDWYAQVKTPAQHVRITPQVLSPKMLRKGFITSEYESPETVAQRLTAAVQKAYTPAVQAAKLAESEARRAREMAQTSQTLTREKKEALERLQGLQKHLAPVLELGAMDKQEFARLVQHAQERAAALKLERSRAEEARRHAQERQRRVDDLARVERTTAGAAHTFAQHALRAIKSAGGDASRVDWRAVEKAAVLESVTKHRQQPKDALAALVKHSPGLVEPARQEQARAFISELAGREIAAPKISRGGPTLG